MGLLLLARGLQRRIDAAFVLTSTLLAAGVIFSSLKYWTMRSAVIFKHCSACSSSRPALLFTGGLQSLTRSSRSVGYRNHPGFTCSVWLSMFSYSHVGYSHESGGISSLKAMLPDRFGRWWGSRGSSLSFFCPTPPSLTSEADFFTNRKNRKGQHTVQHFTRRMHI